MSIKLGELKQRLDVEEKNLESDRLNFQAADQLTNRWLAVGAYTHFHDRLNKRQAVVEHLKVEIAKEEAANVAIGDKVRWFKSFLLLVEECNRNHPADPNEKVWQVGCDDGKWYYDSSNLGAWAEIDFVYTGLTSLEASKDVMSKLDETNGVLDGLPCPFVGRDGKRLGGTN